MGTLVLKVAGVKLARDRLQLPKEGTSKNWKQANAENAPRASEKASTRERGNIELNYSTCFCNDQFLGTTNSQQNAT